MKLNGIVFQAEEPKEQNVLWVRVGSESWSDASEDGVVSKTDDILVFKDGKWQPILGNMAKTIMEGFNDTNKYFEQIVTLLGALNQWSGEVNVKLSEIEQKIDKFHPES